VYVHLCTASHDKFVAQSMIVCDIFTTLPYSKATDRIKQDLRYTDQPTAKYHFTCSIADIFKIINLVTMKQPFYVTFYYCKFLQGTKKGKNIHNDEGERKHTHR